MLSGEKVYECGQCGGSTWSPVLKCDDCWRTAVEGMTEAERREPVTDEWLAEQAQGEDEPTDFGCWMCGRAPCRCDQAYEEWQEQMLLDNNPHL